MSVLNITPANFGKGKHELHKGIYEVPKIQEYIDRYERQYLVKMLGADLYNEFVADLVAGEPQTQRFIDIWEAFEIDEYNCQTLISEGMVEMIKGFVYFQYLKDQITQVHVAGIVRPDGENSQNVSTLNMSIYNRYNESVRSYKAIQRLICIRLSNYSGFNGKRLRTAYWI